MPRSVAPQHLCLDRRGDKRSPGDRGSRFAAQHSQACFHGGLPFFAFVLPVSQEKLRSVADVCHDAFTTGTSDLDDDRSNEPFARSALHAAPSETKSPAPQLANQAFRRRLSSADATRVLVGKQGTDTLVVVDELDDVTRRDVPATVSRGDSPQRRQWLSIGAGVILS